MYIVLLLCFDSDLLKLLSCQDLQNYNFMTAMHVYMHIRTYIRTYVRTYILFL